MTGLIQAVYREVRQHCARRVDAIRTQRDIARRRRELRRMIIGRRKHGGPIRVILGGAGTSYEGWVTTEGDVLDITNPDDWSRYFSLDSIDGLLAEHVLEHLSETQNRSSLKLCLRYLKPGGLFRIAVPDGHRRDRAYVEEVSPPKDGHQMLFTLESLTAMLADTGFQARPLEYFDADEQFHADAWASADGHVKRSARFDNQVPFKRGDLYYTSLIVDAVKPATRSA